MELKNKSFARKALKDDELEAVSGGMSYFEHEQKVREEMKQKTEKIIQEMKNLNNLNDKMNDNFIFNLPDNDYHQ